jgi:hypothetical protein
MQGYAERTGTTEMGLKGWTDCFCTVTVLSPFCNCHSQKPSNPASLLPTYKKWPNPLQHAELGHRVGEPQTAIFSLARTQNPVRATSCRFDSDLRHLLFQCVRDVASSTNRILLGCSPPRLSTAMPSPRQSLRSYRRKSGGGGGGGPGGGGGIYGEGPGEAFWRSQYSRSRLRCCQYSRRSSSVALRS